MKYLGIDYGSKRIGIAISDSSGLIAFPKKIIPRLNAEEEIVAYIYSEKVEKIVIGRSTNNSGEDNPIAEDAERFGKSLANTTGLSVVYQWEGYTSREARGLLQKPTARGVLSRLVSKKNEPVDAHAAAIMLQSYLDSAHV